MFKMKFDITLYIWAYADNLEPPNSLQIRCIQRLHENCVDS